MVSLEVEIDCPSMRVAIDLSPLGPELPAGVARVFLGAQAALAARGDVELVPIAPPRAARSGKRRALWRQTGFVRELERARVDLVHSFVSAFPLRARVPAIATIHELPWRHGERENAGLVHRTWARLARMRAAAIVCPNGATARSLGARAVHVPYGIEAVFRAAPDLDEGDLRTRLGLGAEPFVLTVGGGRHKKRLALLIEARAAAITPWSIVLTGAGHDVPGVRCVGHVADDELARLYRAASATVVLARSEGFGLPVLESFGCGTPVVVPAGSVQAATAAGLAVEVSLDATTPGGPARALAAALDSLANGTLASGTLASGTLEIGAHAPEDSARAARIARAGEHTWERTASELVALWRRVL